MAKRQNGWRKAGHWEWAKEWASLLADILPADVCEAALATCRLHLRGRDAHRKGAYAFAVHTEMQTFGKTPVGVGACQTRSNWVQLTSIDAANVVLGCFGLTMEDVFAQYGKPDRDTEMRLNLCDVVNAIDPDFALSETKAAVA